MARLHLLCMGALVLAALLAPACAQNLTAINQAALDRHNERRARHGADPLVWDTELESFAVNYAAACNFRHEPNLRQFQQGENLAVTTKAENETAIMLEMIESWYDEVSLYDFNNPANGPPNYMRHGHFTQMVWKETTALGCGLRSCPGGITGFRAGSLVVCRYAPPGNVNTENAYRRNVGPPQAA